MSKFRFPCHSWWCCRRRSRSSTAIWISRAANSRLFKVGPPLLGELHVIRPRDVLERVLDERLAREEPVFAVDVHPQIGDDLLVHLRHAWQRDPAQEDDLVDVVILPARRGV